MARAAVGAGRCASGVGPTRPARTLEVASVAGEALAVAAALFGARLVARLALPPRVALALRDGHALEQRVVFDDALAVGAARLRARRLVAPRTLPAAEAVARLVVVVAEPVAGAGPVARARLVVALESAPAVLALARAGEGALAVAVAVLGAQVLLAHVATPAPLAQAATTGAALAVAAAIARAGEVVAGGAAPLLALEVGRERLGHVLALARGRLGVARAVDNEASLTGLALVAALALAGAVGEASALAVAVGRAHLELAVPSAPHEVALAHPTLAALPVPAAAARADLHGAVVLRRELLRRIAPPELAHAQRRQQPAGPGALSVPGAGHVACCVRARADGRAVASGTPVGRPAVAPLRGDVAPR